MTPPTIGYGIQRALCATRSQFDGTVMSDEKSASMAVQETRITAGAMRMRASRRRRREGMRCITIEFRETEIDRLVDLGHLRQADRDRRNEVLRALYQFLEESALGDAHR